MTDFFLKEKERKMDGDRRVCDKSVKLMEQNFANFYEPRSTFEKDHFSRSTPMHVLKGAEV